MTPPADHRLPIRFGALGDLSPDAALLVEGDAPVPESQPTARFVLPQPTSHPVGCLCCQPRGPVAEALGRLFLARARGEVSFFREVLVLARDRRAEEAVRTALNEDLLVRARFRLAP